MGRYEGNDIVYPPNVVVNKGWERTRQWVTHYHVENDVNRQMKLMLMGDGGVGKTTCKEKNSREEGHSRAKRVNDKEEEGEHSRAKRVNDKKEEGHSRANDKGKKNKNKKKKYVIKKKKKKKKKKS